MAFSLELSATPRFYFLLSIRLMLFEA